MALLKLDLFVNPILSDAFFFHSNCSKLLRLSCYRNDAAKIVKHFCSLPITRFLMHSFLLIQI